MSEKDCTNEPDYERMHAHSQRQILERFANSSVHTNFGSTDPGGPEKAGDIAGSVERLRDAVGWMLDKLDDEHKEDVEEELEEITEPVTPIINPDLDVVEAAKIIEAMRIITDATK